MIVSVIVMIMAFFFIAIAASNHFSSLLDEVYTQNENISDNTIENIDQYLDTVAAIATDANYNYYLQSYLMSAVKDGKVVDKLKPGSNVEGNRLSSRLFDQYLNGRADVSSIMVFCNNSMLLNRSIYEYWSYILDYSTLPWYEMAKMDPTDYVITGPTHHKFILGNTEKTISVSRTIQNSNNGDFLGVMLIDINLNEIKRLCSSIYANRDSYLYIFNDDESSILEYNPYQGISSNLFDDETNTQLLYDSIKENDNKFRIKLNGEYYYLLVNRYESGKWNFVTLYPGKKLAEDVRKFIFPMILLVLLSLSIVIFILNKVLSSIVHPISVLTHNMDSLDNLDSQVIINEKYEDERGKLIESFNEMIKRINTLTVQVRDEENEKRKYELQALHSQINPHFLYNTLDTIVWMAELHDDNIIPVTESLAKLFRISLNRGLEFISVYYELEHVRNYLFIQQKRYGDKLSYDISFDMNVRECKVIKLIVQPLVENSIYHGIKPKIGKGLIKITAKKIGSNLEISVSDNGVGMESDMCNNILKDEFVSENDNSKNGSGVGVRNVNKRIKLYYGEEYGVCYKSEVGVGTTATITLPLDKIMDDKDIAIIDDKIGDINNEKN
jgi:two-component system sensor histidine kinase YesM